MVRETRTMACEVPALVYARSFTRLTNHYHALVRVSRTNNNPPWFPPWFVSHEPLSIIRIYL